MANSKNPEYHVLATIRILRTDISCLAEKSWPHHVKSEQHMGSEKTYVRRVNALNSQQKLYQVS